MGIILRNCSAVHIAGLTIDSTGGDGIYIGRNHEPAPGCSNESSVCHGVASNVHIEDVRSLRNSRQGMSIVAAINVTIERSEFSRKLATISLPSGLHSSQDVSGIVVNRHPRRLPSGWHRH